VAVSALPSWDCAGASEENVADARRTQFRSRRPARQQVVCLVAGVSPRKGDEGYEETSRKTARALDSYAVCRTGAGRVAHKVRHGLAEAIVHLLRRLQQDLRPSDVHNDFCEEAHRPHSSLLRI
jgi:hypothetical protein